MSENNFHVDPESVLEEVVPTDAEWDTKEGGVKCDAMFNQGGVPTISLINKATVDMGLNFQVLCDALQKFTTEVFAPIWGTDAKLQIDSAVVPANWNLIFVDDATVAGALGYHQLTQYGNPVGFVFVRTSKNAGDTVSSVACHELAEMLVDPGIQMAAQKPTNGYFYAYEVCDAVEAFSFEVDGVPMSDFVYPSWFEWFRQPGSVKFSYLDKATNPFAVMPGGYIGVYHRNRWSSIFGDVAAQQKYEASDRRLRRSFRREAGRDGLLAALNFNA